MNSPKPSVKSKRIRMPKSSLSYAAAQALIDTPIIFSARGDWLRRLLTTGKFREKAARAGAAAMFYEAGIANTSAENGVLIYLSLLERQMEVIADRGILKCVPPLKWNH